jgi:hypothetical protein
VGWTDDIQAVSNALSALAAVAALFMASRYSKKIRFVPNVGQLK